MRICLIDDDPAVRDALALGLRDQGFEVLVAGDAAAGLRALAEHDVDAAVTDLTLPGVDGTQLIAVARARWPHLPIVAISGAAAAQGRVEAAAAGADAALVKPFRARQLAELVIRIVEARKADGHGA